MKRPIAASLAGCAATAPMTASMVLMHRLLPRREQYELPPGAITSQVMEAAGVEEHLGQAEHQAVTLLSHFGYGAAAGALYAPLSRRVPGPPVLKGVLFGLFVWTASYLGLLPALGILPPASEHPARRNALMIVAHVIWGAALGALTERLDESEKL